MSYSIVYDKQMIKTSRGYTFLVLSGDNNVWETDRRIARSWFPWFIEKTELEIQDFLNIELLGSNEHFMEKGKWVNDEALVRWMYNAVKSARTIEEIREINPHLSLKCRVAAAYTEKNIRTTEELEKWLDEFQKMIHENEGYTQISFNEKEPLKLGKKTQLPKGKVLIKVGKHFAYKFLDGQVVGTTSTRSDATVFDSIEEAKAAIPHGSALGGNISYVNAEVKPVAKNYCIKITSDYETKWVYNTSKSRIRATAHLEYAKMYTKSAAKAALERLSIKCKIYTFVLCMKDEKGEIHEV